MKSTGRKGHFFYPTEKNSRKSKRSSRKTPFSALLQKASIKRFLRSRKGLDTIPAAIMLLIMLSATTLLIVAFSNYNASLQTQMKIEKERAQEQIAITKISMGLEQKITNVTITNTGTIEVKIRAFYREENGIVTFVGDPSTPIAQGNSRTIDVSDYGLTVNPKALLVAATERGVKSKGVNEMSLVYGEPPTGVDTSGLSVGPLLMTFDSLSWASCKPNGDLLTDWQQIWTISTGTCAWQLNLTNVDTDNRSLSLNKYSGFTISKVDLPQATTWYLKVPQYTVQWNQTVQVVFIWDNILSARAQTALARQRGINNIFLTVFGNYSDGKTFAQTIPFEALTVV